MEKKLFCLWEFQQRSRGPSFQPWNTRTVPLARRSSLARSCHSRWGAKEAPRGRPGEVKKRTSADQSQSSVFQQRLKNPIDYPRGSYIRSLNLCRFFWFPSHVLVRPMFSDQGCALLGPSSEWIGHMGTRSFLRSSHGDPKCDFRVNP